MSDTVESRYASKLKELGYTMGEYVGDPLHPYREMMRLKFGDGRETFALEIWEKSSHPAGFREAMFNEPITSLLPIDHHNIARVVQVLDFQRDILVILKYPRPPRSTLEEELNAWKKKEVPFLLYKKWMHGVAHGLAHLHTHGYVHRNLSMTNILIKSRKTAQISDYSMVPVANQVESTFENFEVVLRPPRTPGQIVDHPKDDVWTFGVILFKLMSQSRAALVKHPDPDHDDEEWEPEEYNEQLLGTDDEWRQFAFVNGDLPQGAKLLLSKILLIPPEARCTMQEISDDSWLQSGVEVQPGEIEVVNISSSGEQAVKNDESQVYSSLSDKFRDEMKTKGFKRLDYLSRGTYGEVHRVLITEPELYPNYDNKYAALKICNLRHQKRYREVNSVRERQLIKNVSHENMIQFLALFEDGNRNFCILMEIATGDLEDVILRQSEESYETREPLMKKYLHDACKGLNHLHSCGWAHRDIKPENCLIKLNGDAAITDFGFSKNVADGALAKTYAGTLLFLSPQLMLKKHYQPKVADVWAFGCSIYRCLSHQYLFMLDKKDTKENRHEILLGRDETVQSASISREAKDLIYNCLCYNECDRYTMNQVLKHSFFSSLQPEAAGPSSPKPGTSGTSSKSVVAPKGGSKTSSGKPASVGQSTQLTDLSGPSGVVAKERSKSPSGKPASLKPSTQQTNLSGKRKRDDNDTSS